MPALRTQFLAFAATLASAMAASGGIVQVFDPSELTGGPFTIEDFEDDIFEPGATYTAITGVLRIGAGLDGQTPSGVWGLSTDNFPDPITITFGVPASSVGLWFGNDDICCAQSFFANLDIFGPGGLIGTISVNANMNDFADQFIGFNSDELVTSVTIRYGAGFDVALFTYIDDVYFNIPTEICPWDCDGAESTDGTVGIVDFLALLSQWGQVGSSCDFDGGGVGITDFLALLANWGPCP